MEPRKLVKAGQSSHTVSLPKQWVERHGLKAGNIVYVEESGDDLLVKVQASSLPSADRSITISAEKKSVSTLRREVTAAYINNYGVITLVGERVGNVLGDVRSMLHGFVALEIAEQSEKQIVIKDFLNTSEVSVEKSIRQMDMLIRSMMKDILAGEKTRVDLQDKDVNRLYFLLVRLLKTALKHRSGQVDTERLLSFWNVMTNLENLADMFKSMSVLVDGKKKDVASAYEKIYAQYEAVMKAYYTRDKLAADSVAASREDVFQEFNTLPAAVAENAKAMVTVINNLARVVIDEDVYSKSSYAQLR